MIEFTQAYLKDPARGHKVETYLETTKKKKDPKEEPPEVAPISSIDILGKSKKIKK